MVIDFQAHFFRIEYMRFFEGRKDYPKAAREQGSLRLLQGPGHGYVLGARGTDMELRLKDMDEAGVDMQVLTQGPPAVYHLEKEVAIQAAQEQNDYLAETIAKYPGRFAGLATLPLQDTDAAVAELDRAIGHLGLHGLLIHSNVAGRSLDDPGLWPVYERVQELDIVMYIHPTYPLMAEAMTGYGMVSKVGYMFDTSLAALSLVFGGVLERFPRLKVIHPHMGAVLPYIMERIESTTLVPHVEGGPRTTKTLGEYYSRIHTDSVCQGPRAFKFGYEFFGPDRILFASDYPFYMPGPAIELVKKADIPKEAKGKIFSENARALLKI